MASPRELTALPAERGLPRAGADRLRLFASLALAVAVIAGAARIAVPLPGTPVPVTLQDLAVLVVGLALGGRRGGAAVATYLLVGALGAPVFSNGAAGLGWLMGPTGGYLLAFPVAAAVLGLAGQGRRFLPVALALPLAHVVTFTGGIAQLALVSGQGLERAIAAGLLPFLPGLAVKSALLLAGWGAWLRLRASAPAGER